ncbi:hypothetical protein BCAR13_710046 [Paraburkholderia caribensis]|nr:hypothetical protein BCAR13_710046 [Paraburkholderia caribensis]
MFVAAPARMQASTGASGASSRVQRSTCVAESGGEARTQSNGLAAQALGALVGATFERASVGSSLFSIRV